VPRAPYTAPMALRIPRSEPLTVDDIYDPPDDGHRYELIDGCLIVTPSPSHLHQRAVMRLSALLDTAAPSDLEVLVAPFDWIVDQHTKLQPDLLVFRRSDVDPDALRVSPVLAVEILSRSTRRLDLGTKKLAIAAGGAAHYWVVDPLEPSITAFDLVDGDYVDVGGAAGTDALTLERPFSITVAPAQLIA
jgi:Uma2 family endonuclease